jgi:transposase-like protein
MSMSSDKIDAGNMWQHRALAMFRAGAKGREIARELGIPKSTVNDFLQRHRPKTEGDEGAKILVYDIETAPGTAFYWNRFDKYIPQERVISFPGNVLTWSAKWLGSDHVMNDTSLIYGDPTDDFGVCESLWHLLDEADIIVAHNGDRFDVKKMNTRWLDHGIPEPSPYRSVDTYKIAKRKFGFDSNRLNDIAEYLGLGAKYKHEGFSMWERCLQGDASAFREMVKYNDQDVLLLEQVYLRMRGWDHLHPNLGTYDTSEMVCPNCGSDDVEKTAKREHKQGGSYEVYSCNGCGKFSRIRTQSAAANSKAPYLVPSR